VKGYYITFNNLFVFDIMNFEIYLELLKNGLTEKHTIMHYFINFLDILVAFHHQNVVFVWFFLSRFFCFSVVFPFFPYRSKIEAACGSGLKTGPVQTSTVPKATPRLRRLG
jgi:hypothetical protein